VLTEQPVLLFFPVYTSKISIFAPSEIKLDQAKEVLNCYHIHGYVASQLHSYNNTHTYLYTKAQSCSNYCHLYLANSNQIIKCIIDQFECCSNFLLLRWNVFPNWDLPYWNWCNTSILCFSQNCVNSLQKSKYRKLNVLSGNVQQLHGMKCTSVQNKQ